MELGKYFIAIMFLAYSYACTAKIYQWVDANGVTQFTQTPPPNKQGRKKIKVTEVKQHTKKAREVRKSTNKVKFKGVKQHAKNNSQIDLNGYVCDVLNVDQFTDELFLLGHLRKYLSAFKYRYEIKLDNYHKKLKKSYLFDKSSLEYLKKSAENYKCMYEWSKKKIARMEPLRLQYINELKEAKDKLDLVESSNPSRNPHYNEYRNKYHSLKGKSHGLIQSLEELDGYGY